MLDGVRHKGEEGQEFGDEHARDGGLSTLYKVSVRVRWEGFQGKGVQAQGRGGTGGQCGWKCCAIEVSATLCKASGSIRWEGLRGKRPCDKGREGQGAVRREV